MSKKVYVRNMFDAISGKYDLLNHLLSGGIDIYWRRKALKKTAISSSSKILDIACGTGDFSITARKIYNSQIFGADLSGSMLKLFQKKFPHVSGKLVQTEAEILPYKNDSFNNIIVAFGVRNFYDIPLAFLDFQRILKSNGRLTILEFSLPKNFIIARLYSFYFNRLLPFIGKIISKDHNAYTYLPESVKEFEEKINIPDILSSSGFKNIKLYKLTFGIVQLIIADKTN